ncbi:MAG: hypothetical protein A3C50_03610 [Candidatus Staskawiczbacteria bacterium RIFCSPHIGHO2_02_FULL_43_16]|uniref:Methyltransferase FkbM domain-containing protein n=1 Tax=Candidatus Staskawiczbacteria bacterium RIFCSPHIGHO2_01_FULL_41_41 TaxID=1802203 RepID=A0A1G2HT51_9BACT|nr:MAG: hypothetical protein A2822_02715 [Candidatus Staskawiczbacteria bacterium RIFCSPHIGHO2_01_FULL_41_41]OGZ68023.1 MAG: hypothetical protein A3C50_03610 [Candidatus Staskawiczbacteria bacterium RIFCSPHIGHO2_02_FULL_43_16]OGZ74589.1 MAG: hypothetical protein A3A12_02410 [Candidatus Staskawiczbacteria bacterium RIFCSPLOWO2_01_FULL_43_17b]
MVKSKLTDYSSNVYSQFGEDGITGQIFRVIGVASRICVEIGAWDGFHLSNTANLWTKGWRGILIESRGKRFQQLMANTKPYHCHCIHEHVEPEGEHSLESILEKAGITGDIDLLSIDVDGDDYHIFQGLKKISPRVIICEYNPTVPVHMELVAKQGSYFGASALALANLAKSKGYFLVAVTDVNCFFVRSEYAGKFAGYDTDLTSLFLGNHLVYAITDYSGKYMFSQEPKYGFTRPSLQLFEKGSVFYATFNAQASVLRMRRLAKRLIPDSWVQGARSNGPVNWLHQKIWEVTGKPGSPPHRVKQLVIREYQKKYNVRLLVETGTYLGDMVYAQRKFFDRIVSIELGEKLFAGAKKRFQNNPAVSILHGDSGLVLQKLVSTIKERSIFWLDGHYSGGITVRGKKDSPIFEELATILSNNFGHIILIDDARCFTGHNGYPTLPELRQYILSKNNQYKIEIEDDMIRVVP